MNHAIPMELDTFYSIDPLTGTLTPVPFGSPEYPLNEYQGEPVAYLDEDEDGYLYASVSFVADHHTFAVDVDFGAPIKKRTPEVALSFIPTLSAVHALFSKDSFRRYLNKENTFLYLTEVFDESDDEPTGFYNLVWASL